MIVADLRFDFDDVIRLWGNGSLLRWLNQIGASEVRQKLSSISLSLHVGKFIKIILQSYLNTN